ncbi:MAG: osmolarity response regulator [Candidatus Methanofastidiosum methylothiophilum]|uniref:Osmolarity response regulator n=1 Tax=Candidatus Methanofastidiosum methylothiophilum TaxID=1705564 RepID=A0A150INJ0_9EURY|nr:MAG: osmolarity response regulator [Candidatus Methanofastidiosum methylthiophilus]
MILWVEDDSMRIDETMTLLRDAGYDIRTAKNIKEAEIELKNLKDELELIILDLILPSGELKGDLMKRYLGLELLRRLRNEGNKVPVIVFTVVEDAKIEKELSKLNVRVILHKGRLFPEDLEKYVKRVFKSIS